MKGKRLLNTVLSITSILALAGCTTSLKKYKGSSDTIVDQDGKGNTQAASHIIYFNHIDGEGKLDNIDTDAGKLPAIVTFEFKAVSEDYAGVSVETSTQHIRYQVTYLACNCREADYNAWTTMYVEMSATKNDLDNPENSRITKILFEGSAFEDNNGHPTEVGHWGDSPAMDANLNKWASEYAKEEKVHGATKHDFIHELAPLLANTNFIEGSELKGLNKATLDKWMTESFNEEGFFEHEMIDFFKNTKVERYEAMLDGMTASGIYKNKQEVSLNDAYAGASVSLDNMLSVLQSLFEYHAKQLAEIKADKNLELFYEYSADSNFKGTYVVEAAEGETTTHITKAQLQAMVADKGTYLVYGASEGCATCQAFAKPVNKYVKNLGQKVYEIIFTDAKEVVSHPNFPSAAPTLFLLSGGEVVAVISADTITVASENNSYKAIFQGFTQNLLSPNNA